MHDYDIGCASCNKKLARFDSQKNKHIPSCEDLYDQGAVPIPNFGWFCSQICAKKFEKKYQILFQHNDLGIIDYYGSS